MTYDIIATGSSGNAVLLNENILIDCGVSYKLLSDSVDLKKLSLILLTHWHSDHFNKSTIRRLHEERPLLRFGCCAWMIFPLLENGIESRCVDAYMLGKQYEYKNIGVKIMAQVVPHNVENCCYHIQIGNEKIFYCTDTGSLDNINAKGYDLYLIEANHKRAELEQRAEEKRMRGEFAYEYNAAKNHLSEEQALDWIVNNYAPHSEVVFLHQHMDREDR